MRAIRTPLGVVLGVCLFAAAARAEDEVDEKIAAARAAWNEMELDEGIRQAEAIARDHPNDARAHALLGEFARTRVDRVEQATAALRKAAELAPDVANHHWALGTYLEQRKDVEGAFAAYGRMFQIGANGAQAQAVLASAYRLQRWPDLETAARALMALQPKNFDAAMYAGEAAFRQNRTADADGLFTEAVERAGDNIPALANLVKQAFPRQLFGAARAGLGKLLDLRPYEAEAHNMLGLVYEAENRLSLAELSLRRAFEQAPLEQVIRVHLSRVQRKSRRYDQALATIDAAIAQSPALADAHNERGVLLLEMARHEEAAASLAEAARLAPAVPIVHVNHGRALMNTGRYAEAEAAFRKALQLAGDNAEIQQLLDQAVNAQNR